MDEELKPCPFCGGKAETVYAYYDYNSWGIHCVDCGAYIQCDPKKDTKEEAIKAWNNRA